MQPTRGFIPELSDEVRDWYWQLIERFRFIFDLSKNLTLNSLNELVLTC